MRRYNPKAIEPKWQKVWEESGIYKAKAEKTKPKKYILEYFPYPSGVAMHVGHVRNYTIGDAMARHSRMTGHNVLHPMGWDAFGLPAENFAIKNNISPRASTDKNIETFKKQLAQLGFSYDWSREINSSSPDYYKWTQWLFLKFYERGLAYRAKSLQNWCPTDQTVLANEQVITKNRVNVCERDGTPVTHKEIEQWFLKITDYADRLVDDLDDLDWPESIKTMQRNWIGRSKGAEIEFRTQDTGHRIKVFTTRPDTIFGATYLVLAPEHPLVSKIATKSQYKEVGHYVKITANKTELDRKEAEKDKTGIFTGAYAINPANKERIPIWIADYVLMSYGTGAIMAVPAHDARDYDFAQKFNLPIRQVIMPCKDDTTNPPQPKYNEVERQTVIVHLQDKSTGKFALLDWHESLAGITTAVMGGIEEGETPEEAALKEIKEEAALEDARIIKKLDWITAARYCASHKNENRKAVSHVLLAEVDNLGNQGKIPESEQKIHTLVWVDEDEVMNRLTPDHQKLIWEQLWQTTALSGEGEMINSGKYNGLDSAQAREKIVADLAKAGVAKEQTQYKLHDWTVSRQRYWGCPIPIIYCDECGTQAVPEKDLPVLLPENIKFKPTGQSPLKDLPEFVNVKCPKCGGDAKRETDTFDTFVDSSWYFMRFTDPKNNKEPFDKDKVVFWMPVDNYIGGAEHAVVHLLYARFWTKVLADIGLIDANEPFKALRNHGMIGGPDGRKMGKRYGNVVTPDELISQGYGADALRLYELFIGPYDQGVDWNPRGIAGTYRFLDRIWTLMQEYLQAIGNRQQTIGKNPELEVQIKRIIHKTIKKVSQDLEGLGFNTAIASLMECVNKLYKLKTKHNLALANGTWGESLIALTQLMAPFAPHITEEIWEELGQSGSVHVSKWPVWDESLIEEETMTLAVQINGKIRAEIVIPANVSEDEAIKQVMKDEKIANLLKGKTPKKTIYVPGRLVSLVL